MTKSKATMSATLSSEEKQPELYHLITLVYSGGCKVEFFAKEFAIQRDPEHNVKVVNYQYEGVTRETFNVLKGVVYAENLVFAPLTIGLPDDIIAVYTTPVEMPEPF